MNYPFMYLLSRESFKLFFVLLEKRRGWWRITDLTTLKEVMASVHGRGIRERELKRMLIRFGDSTLETGSKVTK